MNKFLASLKFIEGYVQFYYPMNSLSENVDELTWMEVEQAVSLFSDSKLDVRVRQATWDVVEDFSTGIYRSVTSSVINAVTYE